MPMPDRISLVRHIVAAALLVAATQAMAAVSVIDDSGQTVTLAQPARVWCRWHRT